MSETELRIQRTFVELADTLVDDYDVIDFLDTLAKRVVDLLGVTACGLVLVDHHGSLNLVAASSEESRLLELFQLQTSEGPCFDCYRDGVSVQVSDLAEADTRWPQFSGAARSVGYRSVQALPMRLRDTVLGAMNLFDVNPGELSTDAAALGQAFADVATIGILHERTIERRETVIEQLQTALDTRVLIEQAKGVLAERLNVSVDEAFAAMRSHARSGNHKLRDVAAGVVNGVVEIHPPSTAGG